MNSIDILHSILAIVPPTVGLIFEAYLHHQHHQAPTEKARKTRRRPAR